MRVPLVQAAEGRHGLRISATSPEAEQRGLHAGMPLTDARAICPSLCVEAADPEGDAAALHRLARWCCRYSPWTNVQGSDGIGIEVTGCAHLFGGEAALAGDIVARLTAFGLPARLAVAPTIGAAWALARHAPETLLLVRGERLQAALAPLPLEALRLDPLVVSGLAKVGLMRIGDLLERPRAPLVARFGPALGRRLDQALGRAGESLQPLSPPPEHRVAMGFAEPLVLVSDIERTVAELACRLSARLTEAGKGTRRVELVLYRVDGKVENLTVRTGSLCREADHLARLFRERLAQMGDELDAGYGFEQATLGAFAVEDYLPGQSDLERSGNDAQEVELGRLADRFVNRFGAGGVVRFAPRPSYLPERAARLAPADGSPGREDWAAHLRSLQGGGQLGRPLLLLSPPEPVTALSEAPDGPPVHFEWHKVAHRVVRADGPERIGPEWWRAGDGAARTSRDYYRVEDEEGRRFWLYRDGLHERIGEEPRWFVHGLFA